jgi:hypothetical protein
MDFGKAFTFMFEDPDWLRKLGIGTLVGLLAIFLSFVLIGIPLLIILLGYTIDTIRNVMDRRQYPLPEWEDWGGFLARGFKVIVAFFVWALPLILVSIPLAIGGTLTENNSGAANALGAILIVCSSCLMLVWGLLLALLSPAIYIRIARTDRLGSAFEFGKLWAFTRDNLGNVIIAIILTMIAGLIAAVIGSLGVIALVIGVLITIPFASLWQYLVQAHLFGQIGANSVAAVE